VPKRDRRTHQPYLKGFPSDLAGPPQERPVTDALRQALDAIDPETNLTYLEQIITKWLKAATDGSLPHLKELLMRIEGKPAEFVRTVPNPIIPLMQAVLNHNDPSPPKRTTKRSPKGRRKG
jgi:hypothetical protein